MIKENRILFVSKLTKLEFLQRKYNRPIHILKKSFQKKSKTNYDKLILGYIEHQKCLNLIKEYFPKSLFIYPWNLTKELTSNFDLIVSIGGDENFKYVIHHSMMDRIFLSVCSDYKQSECRLSSYNINTLDNMVEDITKGYFKIQNWALNQVNLYQSNGDFYKKNWSMDTIYIGSRLSCNISKYKIIYKDEKEYQKSSGILVSTLAGATGWFYAASGSLFSEKDLYRSEFFVREIHKGLKMYLHTKIKSGVIKPLQDLEIHSFMDDGIINIDWTKEYSFNRGKSIKVSFSNKSLKVISNQLIGG